MIYFPMMFHRLQTIYASAGMHGPQFVEPYVSPPKTAVGSSRGSSPGKMYKEPIIHIGDPYDIAIRVRMHWESLLHDTPCSL